MSDLPVLDADVIEDSDPPAPGTSLVEYRPQMVLSVAEAGELAQRMAEVVRAVLVPAVDWGKIPGTPKPSLLKPGAEKLLQLYGLGHHFDRLELDRDDAGKPYAVTYRCTVTRSLPDREVVVSTADAYCGRDEKKWSNPDKTPFHTIIAMAQKRALVNAALRATAASGLFTSDVEDHAPPVSFGSIVQERIDGDLDDAGRTALKEWWKGQQLPRVVDLSGQQAAVVLVQIGRLSSGEEVAPETPSAEDDAHSIDRDGGESAPEPEPSPAEQYERHDDETPTTGTETAFDRRRKAANAALNEVGITTDDARHAAVREATDGQTESTRQLTTDQLMKIRAWCGRQKVGP